MERLDVPYKRACMTTSREEFFTEMLNSLLKHIHCHVTPLSSKNLQEEVSRVMEEEEKYPKRNVNNVTMDTLFHSPVTINAQMKDENVTNERRIALDIHTETIK